MASEWTGEDIVRVAMAALEDANFHELATRLEELWLELEGSPLYPERAS